MRQRNIGKVVPTAKVWFTRKELAVYLGMTEQFVRKTFDELPGVRRYVLNGKSIFYRKDNVDAVMEDLKV